MSKKKFLLLIATALISSFTLKAANESFVETLNNDRIEVIATYDNKMPEEIKDIYNPKFTEKPVYYDYVFITSRVANLREKPDTNSTILGKYTYDTKLKLLQKIKYQGNIWYLVEDENGTQGYMAASITRKRDFRFQMALDKIGDLENFISSSLKDGYQMGTTNTYVPNPTNANAQREKDKYGTSLDQNLMGTSAKGERIVVPDRSVLRVIEDRGDKALVKVLSIAEELEIPKAKISSYPSIKNGFRKVVAVDLENQNFMVFEKSKETNQWELISYVYTKSGIESELGYETPRGYYTVPVVKYVMPYTDETGQKQGSARYAIRFCGGGYLHGTPINVQEEVNREFFIKQKEFTLGTYTGTRKCLRTTEGHAKFLFDWLVKNPNKTSNEQKPTEDAYFIVF